MNLRPLYRDDAGPLLELWNASARYDALTPDLLDEKVWADEGFDPDLALVCEDAARITGFVMGVMRQSVDGTRGIIKLAAVGSQQRHRGIGSCLLRAVEAKLEELGAKTIRVCESPPNYLTPGIDSRYSAAPRFFEKHGYVQVGEACNMTVDLEDTEFATGDREQALADRGIEIRRATAADSAAVAQFLEEHWPPWRKEVLASLLNTPPSLHLALAANEVVAFSVYDANNRGTGWFGPMGTAPAARRQGIGQLLLFRCLADIAAQGHRYATIPWVDPVGFYKQCAGAAVTRIFHRYEKVVNL
jgi:ribosomal protein S18 acetylase RimI-like enzyme